MPKINHSTLLLPDNAPLFTAQNRAFNYGDGLFETLRVIKGEIPYLDYHFERLKKGMEILQFEIPASFTAAFFHKEVVKLTGRKKSSRVRFTAYRSDGGLYNPASNEFQFLLIKKPLKQSTYKLGNKGLVTGLFDAIPLSYNILSPIKTTNALPYVLAAKYKSALEIDDVMMINSAGRIAEASSSNIVIWNGKKLITPRLKEGCVAGIIRSVLLNRVSELDLKMVEKKVSVEDLHLAKAVFLTNSIQGVKWVRKFGATTYEKRVARPVGGLLLKMLNKASNHSMPRL